MVSLRKQTYSTSQNHTRESGMSSVLVREHTILFVISKIIYCQNGTHVVSFSKLPKSEIMLCNTFAPKCKCSWSNDNATAPITMSHKLSAGIPSDHTPASNEIISASVALCATAVCFLQIKLVGTDVWVPKIHNIPPDVDFESFRSPAKSAS